MKRILSLSGPLRLPLIAVIVLLFSGFQGREARAATTAAAGLHVPEGQIVNRSGQAVRLLGLKGNKRTPIPTATTTNTPIISTATETPVPPTAVPTPTGTTQAGTLFSDTFEQDAVGSTPSGWTTVGGTWTVQPDGSHVVSQSETNATTGLELVGGSADWTDYAVSTQVKPTGSTSTSFGITGRWQDANNNYNLLLKQGNTWFVGKRVGGTWITLSSGTYNYTTTTWYTLQLTFHGSTITASINGSTLASVNDTSFAAGRFSLRTSGTPEYDNVLVTGSGTITPTATPTPGITLTATNTPIVLTPTKAVATMTPTNSPVVPTPTNTLVPTSTTGGTAVRAGGINSNPSYRPWRYLAGPEPDSWWCQAPNCLNNVDPIAEAQTELALDKHLGVANVRLEFPWRFIETGNGVYDWSRADALVNAANAAGVQLQAILVYSPSWVSSNPADAPTASQFSSFVTAIVNRYKASIHYWEMWNEPDLSKYWTGTEASYVSNILIPGYQAVHSADATAKVILGGPSSANTVWLNGIYSDGGGNSFDIMAFHDYGGSGAIFTDASNVQSVLNSHGQGSKPIWLGEYGAQDSNIADTSQQSLISGVLGTNSGAPPAMAQLYTLRDQDASNCCPPSVGAAASWGIVLHDDVTKKNGYYTMQSLLGGH